MQIHFLTALSSIFVLSACMSHEEIAQREAYERDMRDQNEIYECQNLGFEPGSNEFGNCRLQLRNIQAQQQLAAAQYAAATQPTTIIVEDSDRHEHHDHDRHERAHNDHDRDDSQQNTSAAQSQPTQRVPLTGLYMPQR